MCASDTPASSEAAPKQADIVIVDDIPANLRVLSALLQAQGYHIRPVTSGKQALKAIYASLPDLILLDLRMPEMDGHELCQHLKADVHTRDIPIVCISVADDIESKVRSFELGAVDFVSKPFAGAEVLARVNTHIQVARLQASLREKVNQLEQAYDHIKELSIRDTLTGLYNRRYFDKQVNYLLTMAKRYEHPFSVAMVDIDHFKSVNDRFSHAVGDQVLVKVAELLQQGRRGTDIVARYGGEEFIIALPETTILDAAHSCELSRQMIEDYPWQTIAEGLQVTISAGLSSDLGSRDVRTFETILDYADAKLYEAKHAGRNQVKF